jgi:hypothetical protein
MQLPLRAVQEHSETLIADDEHVIVAVMHSSDCLVNADVLVTAVNERAADKAEIERLRVIEAAAEARAERLARVLRANNRRMVATRDALRSNDPETQVEANERWDAAWIESKAAEAALQPGDLGVPEAALDAGQESQP